MTKTEYQRYINSADWRERRKEFLEESGSRCEHCNIPRWLASIAYDQDLHAHHLTYENLGNESFDDLQALCRRCHQIETFGRSELREVPSAICNFCNQKHWDPRQDLCSTCLFAFGIDTPGQTIRDLCAGVDPCTGNAYWKTVLEDALLGAVTSGRSPVDIQAELNKLEIKYKSLFERKRLRVLANGNY